MPISRQRQFQLKWMKKGKCGYCAEHPEIFSKDRCKSCHEDNLKRGEQHRRKNGMKKCQYKHGKGSFRAKKLLKEKIQVHVKWLRRYQRELRELEGKE